MRIIGREENGNSTLPRILQLKQLLLREVAAWGELREVMFQDDRWRG